MSYQNRPAEEACLLGHLTAGECCAVVGLSNTGKSALLRAVAASTAWKEQALLFYIDCNRMLNLSEQGFYEAILRAVRARLSEMQTQAEMLKRLEQDYQQVVNPASQLAIPLGFTNALERLCEEERRITLILDEFDEPFEALDGRAFLNLRALHDRYRHRLTYVTATAHPLEEIRDDRETGEFRELFVGRVCRLKMLEPEATRALTVEIAGQENLAPSDEEVNFVAAASGGHPGLVQHITRLLLRARLSAPRTYAQMGVALVNEALVSDEAICGECKRLWTQLAPSEREAILVLTRGEKLSKPQRERLELLGLVDREGKAVIGVLTVFARQQQARRKEAPHGVWIDEEAGEVYVDGQQIAALSELEYRLLRSLYQRQGKLCDKYRLVEEVWGESYIDEVDDARIEKLVSRVRAKIERDPAAPRYLVTVRGRGYRLQREGEQGTRGQGDGEEGRGV